MIKKSSNIDSNQSVLCNTKPNKVQHSILIEL